MTGSGRAIGRWMVAACAAVLALLTIPGCGHSGDAGLTLPRTPKQDVPALTGVVEEPNGELAKADQRWWPSTLQLLPRAYAQAQNVFPVPDGIPVILSLVDYVDASDGMIGNTGGHAPQFIAQTLTDPDGNYEILDQAISNVDVSRLMVSVGSGPQLTRAFVYNTLTNIDYRSEALIEVVLQRLTRTPPVQLFNFTSAGLQNIFNAVDGATATATGSNVRELNSSAVILAMENPCVLDAIDRATGVPVNPPHAHCQLGQ